MTLHNPDICWLIWSGEHRAWWRRGEDGSGTGYSRSLGGAGRWTKLGAVTMTAHCGPDKQIDIVPDPYGRDAEAGRWPPNAPPWDAVVDLLDIAVRFEAIGDAAHSKSYCGSPTHAEAGEWRGEARAWRRAAKMLRMIKLEGPGS